MKKRFLALFLCLVMVFALVACGGNGETPSTDSDKGALSGNTEGGSDNEEVVGFDTSIEHKVIATDIRRHSIVVFDLNKCNGDFELLKDDSVAVVWEWDCDDDPNCMIKPGYNLDSAKFRYSPYYGKDVIVACASNGWVGVIDYEARSLIWEYKLESGPHSVEMLPNGDVVVSVSTEVGAVVYFPLSAGVKEPSHSLPSTYSHGVSWDPQEKMLWVLEDDAVVAFRVNGAGTADAKLVRVGGMGAAPGVTGGHALAPVAGQPGKYWASFGAKLFVFDSEDAVIKPADKKYVQGPIKGICSFADNTVVQVIAGKGELITPGWSSRELRIYVKEVTSSKVKPLKDVMVDISFPDREFYKIQAFTKDYQ